MVKFRHDLIEGDRLPKQWFCYGKYKAASGAQYHPVIDYWVLKFPSYQRMSVFETGRIGWHQLAFMSYSHGEWFDAAKQWHPGRRLFFGLQWIDLGEDDIV